MRDVATAAQQSDASDFVPLVSHVVEHARVSLARTPEQLAVLRKAGVVDAGAKGFVSMLEGVLLFVEGISLAGDSEAGAGDAVDQAAAERMAAAIADFGEPEEQYRYCTEALVRGDALPTQQEAQSVLRDYGDSLIVIRSGDVLKVHVHTDEPEEVFTWLRGVGTLVTHKAEDMKVQHETIGRAGGHVQLARRPVGVVTDSAADLPREIVNAHGVHVVPLAIVHAANSGGLVLRVAGQRFKRRAERAGSRYAGQFNRNDHGHAERHGTQSERCPHRLASQRPQHHAKEKKQ